MDDSWRDEFVTKGAAANAARDAYKRNTPAAISAMMAIKELPSVQPQSTMGQLTDAVQSTKDCISRQAAIDCCRNEWEEEVAERIEALPSVQPHDIARDMATIIENEKDMRVILQPQRIKGRWVRKESDLSWWYECSECGESPLFDPYENEVRTPFCPWCGAELRGEDDV